MLHHKFPERKGNPSTGLVLAEMQHTTDIFSILLLVLAAVLILVPVIITYLRVRQRLLQGIFKNF
ncbi:MAG: hypothetical protein ABSE39_08070 [Candidatus Bathyarchaeia archaeon]